MCALLWQYANKSSGEVPFGTWTGKAAIGILEQKEKENEKFPQKLTAVHPRHCKSPVQVCLNHSGDTLHIVRLSERGLGVFFYLKDGKMGVMLNLSLVLGGNGI